MRKNIYLLLFLLLSALALRCSDGDEALPEDRNYLNGQVYALSSDNFREIMAVSNPKFVLLHNASCASCPQALVSFRSYAQRRAGQGVFLSMDTRQQANLLHANAAGQLPAVVVYNAAGLEIGRIESLGVNEADMQREIERFLNENALLL